MMCFGKPHLVCKSAGDGFLIGISSNIVVSVAAIGELCSLSAGELLEGRERLLVLASLEIDPVPALPFGRKPEAFEKLAAVGGEQPNIGVDRKGCLKQGVVLP